MVTFRSPAVRRGGAEVERAILDAALERLGTQGRSGLTLEGVAARARTGDTAVDRRCRARGDPVADALRAGLPETSGPPDRDDLREDLLAPRTG